MTDLNPFAIAQQQLDEAAKHLGLDKATHELLRWPMREWIQVRHEGVYSNGHFVFLLANSKRR